MAHSLWQTLVQPLNPRIERWVRRGFGAVLATLAMLAGVRAIQLTLALYRDTRSVRQPGGYRTYDPHGFGFMTLVLILIPGTVLCAFGAVSVWRRWSVPWWLPLLTMLALGGGAYALVI